MNERKFPDPLIETIRNRTDLIAVVSEHLTLKRSGRNFVGLCPFHSEKTASFVVNPEKQFFHCFGCSTGGDVFHFLSKIEQITFPEAVRRLAERAGVTLPSYRKSAKETTETDSELEQIYQINEEAAWLFHQNLMERPEATDARRYLKERGLSVETIKAFSIGFALPRRDDLVKRLKYSHALLEKACLIKNGAQPLPGKRGPYDYFRNRIILPIRTLQGRVVGFGGRVLDNTLPKYLNTSETPVFTKGKHLFGLHLARGKKSLIIVEGYFDAIALYQNGISNAVATLGTAITSDHLQLIHRFVEKVFLIFDPDAAGVAATLRAAPLFLENGITAEVVSLPPGEDPDLFIRRQGEAAFLEKLKQGTPLIPFTIMQAARSSSSPSSIEEKTKAIRQLFPLVRKAAHSVQRGHYFKKIAEEFEIDERDVRADFAKQREGYESESLLTKPMAASLKNRLPQDEQTLLALLIQGMLDPTHLRPLSPDDFTTPQIKGLIRHFWDKEKSVWIHPVPFTDRLDETERALFTELAVLEIFAENRQTLQEDSIRSLQTKRLRRETLKIQKELKLAEREKDRIRVVSLQQTFFNLKKELSQMVALPSHGS